MNIKKNILFSAIFVVSTPLICLADSASMSTTANTVKILDNNEIQMVDESIKIIIKGKTEVDVIYTFENRADKNVSVKMGFPEKFGYGSVDGERDNSDEYEFCGTECKLNDFQALEEGKSIKVIFKDSKEAVTKNINWYIYEVNFKPYERKKIQNKYWVFDNGYYGNRGFGYILETGASWKDKIEKIDIEVKFEDGKSIYDVTRVKPNGYVFNEENNSIEWRLSDIEPTKNDNIGIGYKAFPYCNKGGCWWEYFNPKFKENRYEDMLEAMSSSYLIEDEIDYCPYRAIDRDEKTAWVEDVAGSGIGEWINIEGRSVLLNDKDYNKIKIFNGFGKSKELWQKNNRVKKLKVIYPNNQKHIINLKDVFGYQTIDLPEIIRLKENGYIKLEIMEVYKGTDFDDTAISEVILLGLIGGDVIEDNSIYNENYIFVKNYKMHNRLKGKILLKVEDLGKAYYINPANRTMSYLNRPVDAFQIMREQGIGITNENLEKIGKLAVGPRYNENKVDNDFVQKHLGKIFLQVENHGEAWYVNPEDGKRYFLGRPSDAFQVMRNFGLGISNSDFEKL
ncbi:DUF4424 family protein [bacterium]|nr:DUF4424 family protein [bacterium]